MAWKTLHFEWENHENRWKMGPKTFHFPAWQLSLPLPTGDWPRLTESLDLIKAGGQTVEKVEQLLNDEDWRAHCEARLTCPLEQPWCGEHPNIQWTSNEYPMNIQSTSNLHNHEPCLWVVPISLCPGPHLCSRLPPTHLWRWSRRPQWED